jgi:hypothetical protein
MGAFASPLLAAALLLGLAGAVKVVRPAATRVALRTAGLPSQAWVVRGLGAVEVAFAAVAVIAAGRLGAALVAASYVGFAGFSRRLERASRGTADCGCFGSSSAPVGPVHVGVNLALAACTLASVAWPTDGIASIGETPWAGVPFLLLTALLTWMIYVSLTVLPATLAAAKAPAPATGASS